VGEKLIDKMNVNVAVAKMSRRV